ncbi:C5 [Cordylochernes scorpioides]|uniref:C5 n=1 Tax=Cordylochernes scorpioides TaxID=51811 RepID=A0ABY6LCD0_9ARAC|nr:C5 [Cordylochernes scorpioides]
MVLWFCCIGSDGMAEYNATLPHSITEWTMQAISVSLHSPGVCVADSQSLISTKPLFIQLTCLMPWWWGSRLSYGPLSSTTIMSPSISVDWGVSADSIDARHHRQHTEITLQPPQDFVPGTESCIIMAIGDQYGPTVQTAITGVEHLMSQPTGCGEQTMIRMAPTLYALHYLTVKKQVTPEIEEKAYQYLKEENAAVLPGYKRALTYRKYNGAFSVWTTHPPSNWLTAFILKIFCQARQYIPIDDVVISRGLHYLSGQQDDDGSFREVYTLHHPEMLRTREVRDKALEYLEENLNSVLEPYSFSIITYALALANHPMKNATNQRLRNMAVFNEVTNERWWYNPALPVSVEATSYGLLTQLLAGDLEYSQAIVNWLNGQRSSSGSFVSTQMKYKICLITHVPEEFLQQIVVLLQDTVMGLQALTEYAMKAESPAINLVCNISYSQDLGLARTLEFQPDNAFILQQFEVFTSLWLHIVSVLHVRSCESREGFYYKGSICGEQVNKIGGVLYLNTTGKGVGQLLVKMKYNIPRSPEKVCKVSPIYNHTRPPCGHQSLMMFLEHYLV